MDHEVMRCFPRVVLMNIIVAINGQPDPEVELIECEVIKVGMPVYNNQPLPEGSHVRGNRRYTANDMG